MTLDELISDEKKDSDRRITSRKNPKNIEVPETAWKEIIALNPEELVVFAREVEESEAKCLVSMMDDAIEDGVRGWKLHDEDRQNIKEAKEEIIQMYEGF